MQCTVYGLQTEYVGSVDVIFEVDVLSTPILLRVLSVMKYDCELNDYLAEDEIMEIRSLLYDWLEKKDG